MTLRQIQEAVDQLPPEDFSQLRRWILKRDAEAWDRQIESDARNERQQSSLTFDEFLAGRLQRPTDVEPVTLEDMERAIARGALGGDI